MLLFEAPFIDGWFGGAVVERPPAAPLRLVAPSVQGILRAGNSLTVDPVPVYVGNPLPAVSWRWQARPGGGGTIANLQSGGALALTGGHVGLQIRLQDMASNPQGSTGHATGAWLGPVDVEAPASRFDASPWADAEDWTDAMTWSA